MMGMHREVCGGAAAGGFTRLPLTLNAMRGLGLR
jgi:hypothetical protein